MENNFVEHISNEQVAALPTCRFDGKIVIVDKEEKIAKACLELTGHQAIGFDTETRPTFRPGALNKVALLQLSTPDTCYLFRLCTIPLDRDIIRILESKTILKIGADVKGDLRALQALRHFKPGGFIDLQSTASQWGIAEKSVRKMAAIIMGVRVSKAQRLSNWEASSLTDAQQQYAATDAWACLRIFEILGHTPQRPLPTPEPSAVVEKKKKRKKPKNETTTHNPQT